MRRVQVRSLSEEVAAYEPCESPSREIALKYHYICTVEACAVLGVVNLGRRAAVL